MKKRIALFHDLPPGGAKRSVYETFKGLKKDFEVEVFTLPDRDKKGKLFSLRDFTDKIFYPAPIAWYGAGKTSDYKNWRERLSSDFYALFFQRFVEKRIADQINHRNYDLALVHHTRFTHAPYLLRYLKIPSIYYCQEPPRAFYEKKLGIPKNITFYKKFYEQILRKTKKIIDKKNAQMATLLLVNSCYSKIRAEKIYQREAQVCYLGVNQNKFKPLGLRKQDFVIAIGNAEPQKNFGFLIETLSLIPEKERPGLLIIGHQHPEKTRLKNLAKKLGVFLLWEKGISDDKLVKRYNQALMMVVSALREPLGLGVLEAMACGVPVVAVKEGGIKETILDGKTGFLVKRDKKKMVEKIVLLLKNKKLREKMGREAREQVLKNWTLNKSIENLRKFLP